MGYPVYTSLYTLGGVHPGMYSLYALGGVHPGIYASLLYPPGYTLYIAWSSCSLTYSGEATAVYSDEALGSTLGYSLGMRRGEGSFSQRCESC